ncbi:cation-translocating P-type ATPase [Patescibacteria group bacterium]|nr:cation-translocating P-type ATPase [Patescibacteria group bacterium]
MWYQKTVQEVFAELRTNPLSGLTKKEAERRLNEYGQNLLPEKPKPSLLSKFIDQFRDILILILLFATAISLLLGETVDAIAILAIVILNSTIGFIQEIQAEKTLESLKEKDVIYALVLRDGNVEKILFPQLVPGDILILEEGSKVPADARIVESFSLRTDESILTGESKPTSKNAKPIEGKSVLLADRKNIIFKDTEIIAGRGKAVVFATGKNTEIGKIAQFLGEVKNEKTPLTLELQKVGKTLTFVIGIIAVLVFILNYLNNLPFVESLLVAISLAVAAIPEGLPAIVTIVLSIGVKRLAEKKTIVKKLPAVETLGAVRIIATDKTGTLTQNKINVVQIALSDGENFTLTGEGYNPNGEFIYNGKIVNPLEKSALERLLTAGVLANDATISGLDKIIGDTTEAALLVAAQRAKLKVDEIKTSQPRLYEVPFSAERKMMSVVVKINDTGDHLLYAKGAPEVIMSNSTLTAKDKKKILEQTLAMAKKGLRSLAVARKKMTAYEVKKALEEDKLNEKGMEFLGLVGMQDPLRPEIRNALNQAKIAGITTVMITGDHRDTAASIALAAGIISQSGKVLTEDEIEFYSRQKLAKAIQEGVHVFARISPMGKLKIVEAIKSIPNTQVAVTGDGVNDAPAISASHIGIAMGMTGTDLTREVADMVITDDNYATIVDAVREGRVIFANLVKFIRYLISCNLSEVIVVTGGVLFGTPLPLLPIQILWINLITDGMPALALGLDPPEFDVMKKPPRDIDRGILYKKRWIYMLVEGSIMGIAVFGLFLFSLSHFSYTVAQTMTFAALALSQLVHAFNNRSTRKSLFSLGIFTNKYLVVTAIVSVILQILVIQTYWGNLVFQTSNLNSYNWLIVGLVSLIPFVVVETKKQLRFRILP